MEVRALRQQAVLDTLYQVEKVGRSPFPDDPPLIYPDAQTWENLTNSRKKYAQVDFATTNKAEQKIMDELDRTTKIDFFDDTLADAISYLEAAARDSDRSQSGRAWTKSASRPMPRSTSS